MVVLVDRVPRKQLIGAGILLEIFSLMLFEGLVNYEFENGPSKTEIILKRD